MGFTNRDQWPFSTSAAFGKKDLETEEDAILGRSNNPYPLATMLQTKY
jgi:hypothetical protein